MLNILALVKIVKQIFQKCSPHAQKQTREKFILLLFLERKVNFSFPIEATEKFVAHKFYARQV